MTDIKNPEPLSINKNYEDITIEDLQRTIMPKDDFQNAITTILQHKPDREHSNEELENIALVLLKKVDDNLKNHRTFISQPTFEITDAFDIMLTGVITVKTIDQQKYSHAVHLQDETNGILINLQNSQNPNYFEDIKQYGTDYKNNLVLELFGQKIAYDLVQQISNASTPNVIHIPSLK